MLLIILVIHLVPKPPDAFIISLTTPVGSAAFPIVNPLRGGGFYINSFNIQNDILISMLKY